MYPRRFAAVLLPALLLATGAFLLTPGALQQAPADTETPLPPVPKSEFHPLPPQPTPATHALLALHPSDPQLQADDVQRRGGQNRFIPINRPAAARTDAPRPSGRANPDPKNTPPPPPPPGHENPPPPFPSTPAVLVKLRIEDY